MRTSTHHRGTRRGRGASSRHTSVADLESHRALGTVDPCERVIAQRLDLVARQLLDPEGAADVRLVTLGDAGCSGQHRVVTGVADLDVAATAHGLLRHGLCRVLAKGVALHLLLPGTRAKEHHEQRQDAAFENSYEHKLSFYTL